ncbi:MAG: YidC/Oxa1 family membrane protein insertase [Thermomicrobiales bacterium]
MLFDAIGSHLLLTLLSVSHVFFDIPLVVPAAIPIWDQYVDFIKWSLDSLADVFGQAGLAIIGFTIIVKTILLPLTIKATRSSKNMQELQPKIKELQKKFGKDRQKLSQETMALYQSYGVNPMAGCLPMLIQLPIFFGLYRGIDNLSRSGTGAWNEGFMWLSSLHDADPYKILPILAGVLQFIQSRMMRPANQGKITDPQQAIMNQMMNFMPLMVVVFGWQFASGPVIYWVAQSAYSVVQQWFITGWGSLKDWFPWLPELPDHRRLGYVKPRDLNDVVVVSGATKSQSGVQGWLMKRMEEAQKNQAERQQAATKARQTRGTDSTGDDVIDVDASVEGATVARASNRRSSSNYQQRVDSATKFKAKTRSSGTTTVEPATSSANGSGAAPSTPVRATNARKKQRRPSGRS